MSQHDSANMAEQTLQHSSRPPVLDSESVEKVPMTETQRSKAKTIALFVALCIALFLAALDTVLITTALPTIAKLFNVTDAGYAWVGSAYLLTNAASTPFWGKVSDVFGRKPIIILANIIFLVGSLVSAQAHSLQMLIAGRAVQGLGGGGIVILVHICVADIFSLRERGLYLGIVGAVWAVASALGPVLGGAFTEKLSWRWCFYINLPLDGAAIIVLVFFLNVHNPRTPMIEGFKAIDWLGAVTVACATVMFLLGLQFGGVIYPWSSPTVVLLLVFGIVTFALFFAAQFKLSPSPIMPFRIFSHTSNLSALAVCFFDAMVFNSVAYFVPLYFQTVLNATPLQAGTWMLAMAIPLSIFSACAGWIMEKTGRFLELLRGGLFLMTIALGLFINFPDYISWPRIILFLIIVGVGFGPNFMAPLIALQTRLDPKDMAAGTATFGFVRMLSGAIGIVLGQVLFQSQMQTHLPSLLTAGVPTSLVEDLARGSAISSAGTIASLPENLNTLVRQAKSQSLSKMWILYTIASFLGLVTSLGIRKVKLSRQHEEFRTGLDNSSRETAAEAKVIELQKQASTTPGIKQETV